MYLLQLYVANLLLTPALTPFKSGHIRCFKVKPPSIPPRAFYYDI